MSPASSLQARYRAAMDQTRQLHPARGQEAELELPCLFQLTLDAAKELLALFAQLPQLEAAVHQREQNAPVKRFLDEVEGPFVDGPDEGLIGLLGIAGHQDRLNIGLGGLQGSCDLESVHGRKPDVDDRQVGPQARVLPRALPRPMPPQTT